MFAWCQRYGLRISRPDAAIECFGRDLKGVGILRSHGRSRCLLTRDDLSTAAKYGNGSTTRRQSLRNTSRRTGPATPRAVAVRSSGRSDDVRR